MASHSRRFSPSNAVTRRAERHLQGTDYLVSCVPTGSTESQYSLIWAAEEAGVERFVPSDSVRSTSSSSSGRPHGSPHLGPPESVHTPGDRARRSRLHDHSGWALARVTTCSNRCESWATLIGRSPGQPAASSRTFCLIRFPAMRSVRWRDRLLLVERVAGNPGKRAGSRGGSKLPDFGAVEGFLCWSSRARRCLSLFRDYIALIASGELPAG